MKLTVVHSTETVLFIVYSSFIVATTIVCVGFVIGSNFRMHYFVSLLVLQSSRLLGKRELVALLLLSFLCCVAVILISLFSSVVDLQFVL